MDDIDILITNVEIDNRLRSIINNSTLANDDRVAALIRIETIVEDRLTNLASALKGVYVPPSDEQILSKFEEVIKLGAPINYFVDPEGNLVPVSENKIVEELQVRAYNESGKHGIIYFPNSNEGTFFYRGLDFDPNQHQVAPLARFPGISVADIYGCLENPSYFEELIKRVPENEKARIRAQYEEAKIGNGGDVIQNLLRNHIFHHSGERYLGLWVSATSKPNEAYPCPNIKGTYGNFIEPDGTLHCIMILSLANGRYQRINGNTGNEEIAIEAEIKEEIVGFVPVVTNKEPPLDLIKSVEEYFIMAHQIVISH